MSERPHRSNFQDIFRPELHAVEARRRRYRIEQLIGYLPPAPPTLPPAADADQVSPGMAGTTQADATPGTLDEVREAQQEAEAAREALAAARRQASERANALTCAHHFLEKARTWHAVAVRYRDGQFRQYQERRPEAPPGDWESAEALVALAAGAMAGAAHEVRVEKPGKVSAEDGDVGMAERRLAPSGGGPGTPEAGERLGRAFGLILACENAVNALLETDHAPGPEAETNLRHALFRLAVAERAFYAEAALLLPDDDRRPACRAAEAAASQEVQRRQRDWNAVRAGPPVPATPPGGGEAAGQGGGPPPAPVLPEPAPPPAGDGGPPAAAAEQVSPTPPTATAPPASEDAARRDALDLDLVGLALSGGGIRSATFGLGVLQGLAQLRLLGMVDYLSTVSGGGYVGSWFAAWVHREGSLINVEKQLSPNRVSQARAVRYAQTGGGPNALRPLDSRPRDAEPEPVHHLRAYSRYLSPRIGPYSPDTWTLFTIYFRNLFVNALFFFPLTVALVLLWRLLLQGYLVRVGPDVRDLDLGTGFVSPRLWLTLVFGIAYVVAGAVVAWQSENLFESDFEPDPGRRLRDGTAESLRGIHLLILLPLLIVAVVGPWILSLDPSGNAGRAYEKADQLRYFGQDLRPAFFTDWSNTAQFAVCFFTLTLLPSVTVLLIRWRWRVHILRSAGASLSVGTFNWRGLCANLVLAGCFGVALWLVLRLVIWPVSFAPCGRPDAANLCLLHGVGVPLVFGAMVLGGFGEMALVGRWLREYEREWRSRLAAYLLMGAAAWLVIAAAALGTPWAAERLGRWLGGASGENSLPALKAGLASAWAAVSGGGAWVASRGTDRTRPPGWVTRALLAVAPGVFLFGLLAGVSSLTENALWWWNANAQAPENFLEGFAGHPRTAAVLGLLTLGLGLFFGVLLSVNRFSLHVLYANRLTRCYLGASRRKQVGSLGVPTGVDARDPIRQVNRFTGFDPLDDLPLADLRPVGGKTPFPGPYPLMNCALNCLAGDELAYQDRRADAFQMTPDRCGGRLTGYAPTPERGGLSLGRVMTISGAAVDPNMNLLSPPLTALMTLLNTRLGWWLENPHPDRRPRFRGRGEPWSAAEPGFAWPLLLEFLGLTNEDRAYVHLSDGGHFENLGVYELVRRRCRFIVVVDAGTDRTAASDNMAALLLLVRNDFGVRIELDPNRLQLAGDHDYSPWHCCVGRIRYDDVDEAAVPGLLVYLQATLTGDEPPDLLQYVARNPAFPRQSTLNQFFDEAQFEAYRALGHHVALSVFGEAAARWSGAALNADRHREEVRAVFAHLRQQWYPPLDRVSTEWVAAAQAAIQLEQHLAGQMNLEPFGHACYAEVRTAGLTCHEASVALQELRAVSQTLQVMELAWTTNKLAAFHAHPLNRGWMNTLRRWSASPVFQRCWPILRAEYSRPFVSFCEEVLNLQPVSVVPRPIGPAAPAGWPDLVAQFDQRFAQEWADHFTRLELPAAEFPRQGFLAAALATPVLRPNNLPFIWRLCQEADNGQPPLDTGLALVARTARQGCLEPVRAAREDEAEFLIWLVGPYRSLGVGRKAAAAILAEVAGQSPLIRSPLRGAPLRRLNAYYLNRGGGPGYRLEQERWMDFHFDLGFRRSHQPDRGLASQFIILRRELG